MNPTMKISIFLVIIYVHCSSSFMTDSEFKSSTLLQCYNTKSESRLTSEVINGQEQPLPSSIETFISLIERLESSYPSMSTADVIQKLLISFRVDGLSGNFRRGNWGGKNINEIEKAFFAVPDSPTYAWKDEDFSGDEKCALHFMLSHSVNSSMLGQGVEELEEDGLSTKRPREYGVVSLHGKWKHAFSLSKVLLGILAGLSGNNQVSAPDIFRKVKGKQAPALASLKVNRLYAVTIGDLISVYVNKYYDEGGVVTFLPNGQWNEATCTTQYTLASNNKKHVTNSDIRGAVDGLIIGKKLEEKPQIYQKMRLSQILRLYYGPTGLIDDLETVTRSETQWCNRERNFEAIANTREEVFNFYKLYLAIIDVTTLDNPEQEISDVLSYLQKSSDIFNEVLMEASSECGSSDATMDKRCTTPFDIFAVLDMSTPDLQRNFQIEVIGNLSNNFDVRPNGNSIGVYTNLNPTQNKGLQTIVNNTGVSGCQSCYTKYTTRRSSKNSEIQVFENLNETLTEFMEFYDQAEKEMTDIKSGAPAKVVLYFNYATAINDDYKLRDTIWQVEKNFREATILAVGPSKDALRPFTLNHDSDIFVTPTSAANAADFAAKLRARICKAPAEFQFKECNHSSRSTEAENRQVNSIAVNKKQYWAMFPKYFHRSFGITLKFKPLEGAQIKVCFSRYHYRIIEDNSQYTECFESSGDEIKFYTNNPCHRKNEHTCHPFYFSVEGKKAPSTPCESIKCSSPKDIQFEFQHEGISCNSASFLSASTLVVLLSLLMFFIQKH